MYYLSVYRPILKHDRETGRYPADDNNFGVAYESIRPGNRRTVMISIFFRFQ